MKRITLDEALSTGRGLERSFCCPVHDDGNASASVNVGKGVWYCHACKAHGTTEGYVPTVEDIIRVLAGDVPPRIYSEAWLDVFDAHSPSPYWVKRFGIETATKHRCGTNYLDGSPTYPIRNQNNELIGVVTRHEDEKAKYKYPYGVRTSATFYGEYKPSRVVVLVEGAADVMALDQSGIPDHWTVLGCFGSGLHAPQVQMIADLSPKVVIAAFDDDTAGWGAAQRAKHQLNDISPVLSHHWSTVGGNDPGEIKVGDRITSIRSLITNSTYKKHS